MENQDMGNKGKAKTRKRKYQEFWNHVRVVNDRELQCVFCDKVMGAKSITKVKKHWAGGKRQGVSPCDKVPDHIRKQAVDELKSWKQHKESTTGEHASTHLPLRHHCAGEGTSNSSPSSTSAHVGQASQLAGTPAATTQRATEFLIYKFFWFSGLGPGILYSGDFVELCESFAASGSSNSLVLPWALHSYPSEVYKTLKRETDDYVAMIRESWATQGGCTISLIQFKDGVWAAMACGHRGNIFLKYAHIYDHDFDKTEVKNFVHSITNDIGLNNIAQILVPKGSGIIDCDFSMDVKKLLSTDIACDLYYTYVNIYPWPDNLVFVEYAQFLANIFGCFADLPGMDGFDDVEDHPLLLLSRAKEEKQNICNLIGKIKEDDYCLLNLPQLYSENNYLYLHKLLVKIAESESSLRCIDKKYLDTLSEIVILDSDEESCETEEVDVDEAAWSEVEKVYTGAQSYNVEEVVMDEELYKTEEANKSKICKITAAILTENNTIPLPIFWKSVEAYIRLCRQFHKLFQLLRNENFTYADYFDAYSEIKGSISKEDFCEEDYKMIIRYVDEKVYTSASLGDKPLHFLCPQLRYLNNGISHIEKIMSDILETDGSNNNDRNVLAYQLTAYCEKDDMYFDGEAWSPMEMMSHAMAWWTKWGDKVPLLQQLATKMLNRKCSNDLNWKTIEDMYDSMYKKFPPESLRSMLYIRANDHFKYIANKIKGSGSSFVGVNTVDDLSKFPYHCINEYFSDWTSNGEHWD